MLLRIFRALTKEEKELADDIHLRHPLSKLKKEIECEKITLNIIKYNGLPVIDSIAIDEKWLTIEEYKNMNFLQIFKTKQ